MTSEFLLSYGERNWLIDEYIESEAELTEGDFEPEMVKVGLEEMTDIELIDECVCQMPDILSDLEATFGTVIYLA